ncbi:uncharacterized protein LOC121376239 [Gigantopelta aegis]|uniref:uncharacterized protein LOC121376239 n=1 Tax=Gigantopelta aegis TaxID=1735272 RepID=UPI001B88DF28|nr:uncharacterized protein LOC121376239 [Gigantopelta aegis]
MEEPDSSCDENTKSGYVRVRLGIPGLQVSSNKVATNAEITKEFGKRSYRIRVDCGGTTYEKAKAWDEVPFDIVPEQSFIEVARNFIHVFLKKQNPGKSCAQYMSNHDLD